MLNLPIGDLAMSSELAIAFATCLLAMKHKQCVIKINNGRIIYRKIVILTHILSNCCIFVNQMNVNMRIAIKVLCVVFFLPLIVSCGNKVQYKTLSSFIPMAEKISETLKRLLLFLSLLYACSVYSITVTYRTTYKLTEDGQRQTCDNILDIGDSSSCFYNFKGYRSDVVTDSLLACGYNPYEAIGLLGKMKLVGPGTRYAVFKNYPKVGELTYAENLIDDYVYEENIPQFDWNLLDADTVILGYTAYKATTKYRGRTWTVYYAPDITISDGPWKLCGLPGLILYARESEGIFKFEAVVIANGLSRESLVPWKKKMKHCSAKELASLKKLHAWDSNQFSQQTWGFKSQMYDAQGRLMPPEHKKACLLEETE